MKRTLAITLTVAMMGSLMFMGFAGTAAAQNNGDGDGLIGIDIGDQTTGDATAATEVNVDQNNNNAQVGTADASNGDTVAAAGGGSGGSALGAAADDGNTKNAGTTADDGHTKDSAEQLASPADAGAGSASAIATANAEVNQAQDVNQQNAAEVSDVTTYAESGDNTGVGVETNVDVEVDDILEDGTVDLGDGSS